MSLLKTNSIQHNDASAANITLDGSKNVTCENNLTVDGTSTFSGVSTFSVAAIGTVGTLTSSSATVDINFATANHFNLAMTETTRINNPTGEVAGQSGSIFITQPGSGGPYTLSWGTSGATSHYHWVAGTAPTLSTAANAVDRIDYVVAAADKVHCVASLDVKANS